MSGVLQPILSYAKEIGWRRGIITTLGFVLAVEAGFEVYLRVRRQIDKRKSQKPFCEVRFMNRVIVSDISGSLDMINLKYANIAHLISYIDRAQHSICLSMYILTVKDVCEAIVRARIKRNVIVRVVCCESMVYNEGSLMRYLAQDCLVRFKVDANHLMHHKFCLLDVDWLCAKCLVTEHIHQVGPTPRELQYTDFDRAIVDQMDQVEKAFGRSCVRCDSSKRRSVLNLVSNPLPKGGCLITGSSNWTMPALITHWDNMVYTSLPEMVRPFAVEFQRQWFELRETNE